MEWGKGWCGATEAREDETEVACLARELEGHGSWNIQCWASFCSRCKWMMGGLLCSWPLSLSLSSMLGVHLMIVVPSSAQAPWFLSSLIRQHSHRSGYLFSYGKYTSRYYLPVNSIPISSPPNISWFIGHILLSLGSSTSATPVFMQEALYKVCSCVGMSVCFLHFIQSLPLQLHFPQINKTDYNIIILGCIPYIIKHKNSLFYLSYWHWFFF